MCCMAIAVQITGACRSAESVCSLIVNQACSVGSRPRGRPGSHKPLQETEAVETAGNEVPVSRPDFS